MVIEIIYLSKPTYLRVFVTTMANTGSLTSGAHLNQNNIVTTTMLIKTLSLYGIVTFPLTTGEIAHLLLYELIL